MQPQPSTEQRAKAESFGRQHLTGLVTLLFTDMVDSTALKQRLGRQSLEFFEKHHQLIHDCLARFANAQEIDSAGDSFFLIFAVPSDAVQFALLVQSKLRTLFAGTGITVQDRIGINLGEVVIREPIPDQRRRALFGFQVDLCSRVMGIAKGGQILMTRQVFDSARQVLKSEQMEGLGRLSWVSHGYYQFKGVEEPVEVYEVAEMGHGLLTAPTTSEKARRFEAVEAEPVLGWRPAVGQVVPNTHWVMEQHLGYGGFGEVWLGRHQKLKEQRVFKFCFRADRVRSLKREVTLFRLLKERIGGHPNIVGVQDVFFEEPPYYVMMEYAAGKDLPAWCEGQGGIEKVPLEVRLEIVAQVADALQAAHDAGIIHRDVKPANILVSGEDATVSRRQSGAPASEGRTSELAEAPSKAERPPAGSGKQSQSVADSHPQPPVQVKLTDFGIGQVLSEEYLVGITRAGFTETMVADRSSSQTGTQIYMAPEILAGKPASTRSDIYSLGVVLYQLLEGDFSRPLATDWVKTISDPPLREDLERCFAGDPQERFAGAAQLAASLRSWQRRHDRLREEARLKAEHERLLAEQERQRRTAARQRRIAWASGGIILCLAVVALLLGFAFRKSAHERRRAESFLYTADMNLVSEALRLNRLAQAVELLERHKPRPGKTDLRGWEWRYLWLQTRGDEWATLGQHPAMANGLSFSANGRLLASTSWESTLRIWNVLTRTQAAELPHTDKVYCAGFSLDGKVLASGSQGFLRLWSTESWQLVKEIKVDRWLTSVRLSPDSKMAAVNDFDEASVWDIQTGREIAKFPHKHAGDPFDQYIAYAPDGLSLAVADGDGVTLWDLQHQTRISQFSVSNQLWATTSVGFSPNGKLLSSSHFGGIVKVWDVQNRAATMTLTLPTRVVYSAAFSPKGDLLAAAGEDQMVRLLSTDTWHETAALRGHQASIAVVAFSPDDELLASGDENGLVKLWRFRELSRELARLHYPEDLCPYFYRQACPTPDGNSFMLARSNHTFTVWDKRSLKAITTHAWPLTNYIDGTVSSDGRLVAFSGRDGRIGLWELATMHESRSFRQKGEPSQLLRFSPDARLLASTGWRNVTRIWDVATGKEIATFDDDWGTTQTLVFSPDGRLLATPRWGGGVRLWDITTQRIFGDLRGHRVGLHDAKFSPDGKTMATAGADGTARVWDVQTQRELAILRPVDRAYSVAFSTDGQRLAVGGVQTEVSLWDTASHQQLARLVVTAPSSHGVEWMEFLPDGNTLLVSTWEGILAWRAPSLAEIEAAEKRAEANLSKRP